MTITENRLLTAVSSRLRNVLSRYAWLALALFILGMGVLVVLLVQPSPLTFTAGWSAPQGIDAVELGHPHRALVDQQDDIHLVWQKTVGRKLVAFYARLDQHGQLIDGPIWLSDPNVNAENVVLALTSEEAPLCFWIEKGHEDNLQRVMMARPATGEPSQTVSTSPRIMRDLTMTSDEEGRAFLAWSDNRQGLYDIWMAALDGEGNLSFERQVTDTGSAFVLQPALAAGGGVVHLIYFSDDVVHRELVHRAYDAAGESLTGPLVLSQVLPAQDDGGLGYPLLAVAEANGQLRLYESLGSMVRQRKLDEGGQVVQPAEPLLMGSLYYSQASFARREEDQWLIWADLRQGSQDRFQVYAAPLDEAGRIEEEETRLTFATSSALWPVMLLDSEGGQHVIWQESTGPYAYQLMYINNLEPARISAWQRLGFSGVAGGWAFLLALAQSAILAVITAFVNIWRPAIAWVLTVLALQITHRVEGVRPYAHAVAWVVLLAALFVAVPPETETLGQMPIVVADAARWVMVIVASAVVLYLGRVWRAEFRGVLIWGGVAGLWSWVYYFLNLTLILREGFAI